jgi:cell wall-associated NlpC family hydrolase
MPPASTEPAPSPLADAIVTRAQGLVGTPYHAGGAEPGEGFDCSGFVQFVVDAAGGHLPRSVREQWQAGVPVDRVALAPGDLVFFAIDDGGVSHVGIALGDDRFVHAPSSRGVVRVERLSAAYWAKRYAGARRLGVPAATSGADRPPLAGCAPPH